MCTRCIYDSRISEIVFDEKGVCSYCHQIDSMQELYGTGTSRGLSTLEKIILEVKEAGKGKQYDCLIGVSGGTDSSYLLHRAVEWGLRPLAINYDNGWGTDTANENIKKMVTALNVDIEYFKADTDEVNDIYRAFFRAGVPEFDACTDLAIVEVPNRIAEKHSVRYFFEGHSFQTEGISPRSQFYFDGGYVLDVHRKFGTRPIDNFPNLTFSSFLKWTFLKRLKRIRPLWYINYSKEEAKKLLKEKYGWEDYGGHHLENFATAFNHKVWFYRRFGMDMRWLSLAASVRSGTMSRSEALAIYREPIPEDKELVRYFKEKLSISDDEFEQGMSAPLRTHQDFSNYKRRFRAMRPFFYLAAKYNLVPMSFYMKYCC